MALREFAQCFNVLHMSWSCTQYAVNACSKRLRLIIGIWPRNEYSQIERAIFGWMSRSIDKFEYCRKVLKY